MLQSRFFLTGVKIKIPSHFLETLEVQKSNLSRKDIYNVISSITNALKTVHYYLKELKQKSTEKFQETGSLMENYQELK